MKNQKKFTGKLIQFEKYDTVKVMTLETFSSRIIRKGLYLECSGPKHLHFGDYYEERNEVKMIVGSQRGQNKSVRITAYCGVKILPTKMVLLEKIKSPEIVSPGFNFRKLF